MKVWIALLWNDAGYRFDVLSVHSSKAAAEEALEAAGADGDVEEHELKE